MLKDASFAIGKNDDSLMYMNSGVGDPNHLNLSTPMERDRTRTMHGMG
jgi:hypothetical protein